MRTHKVILSFVIFIVACVAAYVTFMYVYTDHMFAPIPLTHQPHTAQDTQPWPAPQVPFIHKVNTPQRARQKDKKFGGFEVDVLAQNGKLLAAHDELEAQRGITLETIFSAVKNPAQKVWWLDIKGELSSEEIDAVLQLAARYQIPAQQLFFEVSPGPTAACVKQKNLHLLLPLPDGFDQDHNSPARREKQIAHTLALWEEYHPVALSASFGKYAYLQAYLPHLPKAIYYSATRRPSIKKYFMRRHMAQDSSVKIFMTDEYDWINF